MSPKVPVPAGRACADRRRQQLGALGADRRFFGRLGCRDHGPGAAAFTAVVIGFLVG